MKHVSDIENQNDPTSEQDYPLPPASFDFLVLSLVTQAQFALGLMHFGPPEEKPKPELHRARHTIDLLGIIQDKTRGNLSLEEQRMLENSLTELRFRYVQVYEETQKPDAAAAPEGKPAE